MEIIRNKNISFIFGKRNRCSRTGKQNERRNQNVFNNKSHLLRQKCRMNFPIKSDNKAVRMATAPAADSLRKTEIDSSLCTKIRKEKETKKEKNTSAALNVT